MCSDHPWAATHTCTAREALTSAGDASSFVAVAEHARIAFMGVPCRNLIPMNLHRDEKGDDACQCLTAVDLVDITRPEAVIIEAPAALFVAEITRSCFNSSRRRWTPSTTSCTSSPWRLRNMVACKLVLDCIRF
jgi:hypothetical protein